MTSHLQIVSTPTADTRGTSVLLHFDRRRYLIGTMGEGTQRACMQIGAKLTRVNECFIAGRSEWENTGGLTGVVLTLAEHRADNANHSAPDELGSNSSNRVTFFAPSNTNYQVATSRRFVFRTGLPLEVHEISEQGDTKPYWSDEYLSMWPMAIQSSTASKPSNPRKRSFEMLEQDGQNGTLSQPDLSEKEQQKVVVKHVVDQMFNSTWRLDALYETRLADVRLPAKIFYRDQKTKNIVPYQGPKPGSETADPDLMVLVRKPWPSAKVGRLPPTVPAKEAISYIFRSHSIRGVFDAAKAVELKVQGSARRLLASGQSIQNADGETIRPEQVLGPPRPGSCYAFIDLPDTTYIDALVSRPEWTNSVAKDIHLIIWNFGKGVALDDRVKEFMARMSSAKHIISSPEHCANYLSFDSAAASAVRLQQVDKARYRMPVHQPQSEEKDIHDFPSNVSVAKRGQTIKLAPAALQIVDSTVYTAMDMQKVKDDMPDRVLKKAQQAKEALDRARESIAEWVKDLPGKDVEIVTLGTGSSKPSKYRNVSGTLMRVPGWGSMLFDCGENTIGQLARAFSATELKQILKELKIITISHMHPDHHGGLISIIRGWYQEVYGSQPAEMISPVASIKALEGGKQMLAVIAEEAMQEHLYEYAAMEDYGYSRIAPLHLSAGIEYSYSTLLRSKLRWWTPESQYNDQTTEEEEGQSSEHDVSPASLGLADIQAVRVWHCAHAKAVSLTWPDGFKASFSGDCTPSQQFARIGKDSTVLIHEATFDDSMYSDAKAKRHSTTTGALQVAQGMRAKTCILTHFSQRYQKIPILTHDSGISAPEAVLGEVEDDGMDNTENEAGLEDDGADGDVAVLEGDAKQVQYKPDVDNGKETGNQTAYDWASDTAGAVQAYTTKTDMKMCVAFDMMRVKVGEIAQLQYFTPALVELFSVEAKEELGSVATSKKGRQHGRRN